MADVYDLTTIEGYSLTCWYYFHSLRHSNGITLALASCQDAVPVDATAFPPAC